MREIKFRAWNPETKKMFYDFDQNIKEVALGKSIHLFVYETGLAYKSLMQFTGLKDKNGKEIYEGDVLNTGLGRTKVVQYFKDGFWLNASLEGAEWTLRCCNLSSEIIGNIYENPELLNK